MKKVKLLATIILISSLLVFTSYADWQKDASGRYKYLNEANNQYVVNNWVQVGNNFYFFDTNGYAVTGWYLINGKYYLFGDNYLMQTGFNDYNGKTYYLNPSNGEMVTGWIQISNGGVVDYYYFADNGVMADGWNKIGDKWFYFLNGKCIINTFAEINGVWYHFGLNGAMDTGWINANGKMYYFNSTTGAQMKGWVQDNNANEYYLSEIDGSLVVNTTAQIGGRNYTFDALGKCIAKDQGVYMGVYMGDTNNFGVNLGISPSIGIGTGITSFEKQRVDSEPLEAGSTAGPN